VHDPNQARGKPAEAAREMRALLILVRDNRDESHRAHLTSMLAEATTKLKILDWEHGDQGLVESVAHALQKLRTE
jgi:hypothetical protein